MSNSRYSKLQYQRNSSLIIDIGSDDDNDDDCVVLDGDPEKPVVVVRSGRADDGDDLEIVGEKGQVACRDFPHPRHLCAKFPFNSTPHSVHCAQCHCYVCDSLASCAHWRTASSLNKGHCHATDKDEHWKKLRERTKIVRNFIDTFLSSRTLHQATQVPPRPISSSTPNTVSNTNPRAKIGNSGPQSTSPRGVSKRASPNNMHRSLLSKEQPSLKRCREGSTHVSNNSHLGSKKQAIGITRASKVVHHPRSSFSQSTNAMLANYTSSQPQIHSQPSKKQDIRTRTSEVVPKQRSSISQSTNVRVANYKSSQPQIHSQPSHVLNNSHFGSNKQDIGTRASKLVPNRKSSFSQSTNVRQVKYASSQPQIKLPLK